MTIPASAQPVALIQTNQRIQFVDDKGYLTSPAQLLLQQITNYVGGTSPITPSSAVTTTNAIVLTVNASARLINQYYDYASWSFIADATTVGPTALTAKVGNLASLPVYNADGTTTANTVQGTFYILFYSDAVNSGNGGFILK